MAKRVRLGIEGLKVNETECRLLELVVERSRGQHRIGCEFVDLSRKEMREHLGCSTPTTVRSCLYLVDSGLLEVRTEHLDNGAQVANSYRATALGLEVVRLYRIERDGAAL